MRGTRGIGGMLHSCKCRQKFQGMLLNIPENVLKRSEGYHETFRQMLPNIPGNALKHSMLIINNALPNNVLSYLLSKSTVGHLSGPDMKN